MGLARFVRALADVLVGHQLPAFSPRRQRPRLLEPMIRMGYFPINVMITNSFFIVIFCLVLSFTVGEQAGLYSFAKIQNFSETTNSFPQKN